MGKSSINGPFSMAMLNNQRVTVIYLIAEIRRLKPHDVMAGFVLGWKILGESSRKEAELLHEQIRGHADDADDAEALETSAWTVTLQTAAFLVFGRKRIGFRDLSNKFK